LLQETQTNLLQLQQELEPVEIQQLLSEPYDQNAAFLSITAGVGGLDAQDWSLTLMRMYYKWAVSHNFQVHLVEESCGDEAGINSATLEITGYYAYGYLKSEQGSHARIERISPPNGKARRHTSNACVEVSPILDDSIELEIPEKDLEITWPRYQGNVNRIETWVQVVHLPTGITVLSAVAEVLDGKIDFLIKAYLQLVQENLPNYS
jgi:peptide chain release factor 2